MKTLRKIWKWVRVRMSERNSKRALAVVIGIGGYFGLIDPAALSQSGATVGAAAALWLAADAFLTQDGSAKP